MQLPERASALPQAADRVVASFGPAVLRFAAGLLWLSNVSWKAPPDFGRGAGGCRRLCGFVQAGIDHPVVPGSAWVFREVVMPNLEVFGWMTIALEATLAALLLSGRYLRVAAALGIAQSVGILISVANADHEWYWSYLLMMLLHLAVWLTAASRPCPKPATVAGWVGAYGAVMGMANARRPFTGGAGEWLLFGSRTDLPGDFGRNVFSGSIALGLVFVALGTAALLSARLADRARLAAGASLLVLAAVGVFTSGPGGTALGLHSTTGSAAVLAALGLVMIPPGRDLSGTGQAVEP